MTRTTRKKYHSQPITWKISINFKEEPIGLIDNQTLKDIGYWNKLSEKSYQVDSKVDVDQLAELIVKELHMSHNDFAIRSTADLYVPS